jgi:acetyl-CoA acetyltransferase
MLAGAESSKKDPQDQLQRAGHKRYGLATQCIGAGMGISTVVERLD